MINELKKYLRLVADQNSTRFLSQAWIEVWVEEGDLEYTSSLAELKASGLPIDEKVAKVKDLAQDVARAMISDVTEGMTN